MRHWIKIRLKDTPTAERAADIVEWWKADRRAAEHITKAIHLYNDLLAGNTQVLAEQFPFLADRLALGISQRPEPRKPTDKPQIEIVEPDEEAAAGDLLDSLGF